MVTIKYGEALITSRVRRSLYYSMQHRLIVAYTGKNKIESSLLQNILHWKSLVKARSESALHTHISISKWISNDTATGDVVVQRKRRVQSRYPRCDETNEDTNHVIQCNSKYICELRCNLMTELKI